ncbi:MAG: hypothetical protein KIH64_009880 [Mycobacterium sp.]|nr:hypothetical protein [Mycobacterium sp.]
MKTKTISIVFAGTAVAALAWALPATADPDCVNPDGSPCNIVTPNDVSGSIPGGPTGQVTPGDVSGSIPGGPTGQVTPGDVNGCIPGIGCINIPR